MRKAEKTRVVAELEEALAQPGALILTDYRGLTVKEINELRRALVKAGGRMRVVKNSLLKRALGEGERADLKRFLEGPVAVTFAPEDAVPVLKELAAFAKTHEQLTFKGGWMDGRVLEAPVLEQIATLPPREELLGRLVGVLSAPLSRLVSVLQAGPRDLVLTLRALAEQKEGQAAAGA